MDNKAAVLICTRFRHIGFPSAFSVEPEDFTPEDEKRLYSFAAEAMNAAQELRGTDRLCEVVVADEKYIVLGVMGYLHDLAADGWKGDDEASRPVHGFLGYVWRRGDFTPRAGFPLRSSFTAMLDRWIRPHWDEPAYAPWAQTPHQSAYDTAVDLPDLSADAGYAPPPYRGRTVIVPPAEKDALLRWGMSRIAEGERLSLCTNLYVYSGSASVFRYLASLNERRDPEPSDLMTKDEKKDITPPDKEKERDLPEKKRLTDADFERAIAPEVRHTGKSVAAVIAAVLSGAGVAALFLTGLWIPALIVLTAAAAMIAVLIARAAASRREADELPPAPTPRKLPDPPRKDPAEGLGDTFTGASEPSAEAKTDADEEDIFDF